MLNIGKRMVFWVHLMITMILLCSVALSEGGEPHIFASVDGFFATDVNGTTWAWGEGGAMLGISGAGDVVEKPTAIALRNVVDVRGCGSLNAFLTAEGEVWLAGIPVGEQHPGNDTRWTGELTRLPIDGVREINMSHRGSNWIEEEMLLMVKSDGTIWVNCYEAGLYQLETPEKIVGFADYQRGSSYIYPILEDGRIFQCYWYSHDSLYFKRELSCPEEIIPLESGLKYGVDQDGTFFWRFNDSYTSKRTGEAFDLPIDDFRQLRKLYDSAALLRDGSAFVWSTQWERIEGTYADLVAVRHGNVLLLDTEGNVCTVPGKKYDYGRVEEAVVNATGLNLCKEAPERKTLRLPEEDYYLPDGSVRAKSDPAATPAELLYSDYGAQAKKGIPLYTPKTPQPLNILITTAHGHEKEGRDDTDDLDEWVQDIVRASQGNLRVVTDPDCAEVLVTIHRKYNKLLYQDENGRNVDVYNCTMTISAVMLTDTGRQFSLTDKTIAPASFRISSGAKGSIQPDPPFENLSSLTDTILEWYGLGCKKGSKGEGARRVQEALIERGMLEGKADGSFGPMTEDALKEFQKSIDLEQTGVVDEVTLLWMYYD